MAVVEVKVTKFKARDGRIFDEKAEAVEEDAMAGIDDLLTDSDIADFKHKGNLAKNLYTFLHKNRDEIIDIMGWEYENAND